MSDEMLMAVIGLVVSALLFILILIQWSRISKLQKRYNAMINGTGVTNLQDVIIDIQNKVKALQGHGEAAAREIEGIQNRLALVKGHVAMHRYNAFNDMGHGSDMSFSLAMLDDKKTGVILTAIHGREETYVYGKPIENGESKYSLSPEEKQVLGMAMGKAQ